MAGRSAAAGRAAVFCLPHHGRDRLHHAVRRHRRPIAPAARPAVRRPAGFCGCANGSAPLGFVAVLAGWITTEAGRQPWTVYGLLRTHDSVTPSLTGANVAVSLALYIVVYLLMFPTGIALHGRHGAPRASARRMWRPAVESGRPTVRSKARPRRADASERDRHGISTWYRYGPCCSAWRCFITWCSTVSISASAYFMALRATSRPEPSMSSIAPVWDGNETWLVFGGLGLLAAFPLAFAIIIPAVYFPILIMLLALVFRGVAFEFRFKHPAPAAVLGWRLLRRLGGGDLRAGRRARRFHPGLQGRRPAFRRHLVRLGTPFALLTGLALLFGYALLGAGGWCSRPKESRRIGRAAPAGSA